MLYSTELPDPMRGAKIKELTYSLAGLNGKSQISITGIAITLLIVNKRSAYETFLFGRGPDNTGNYILLILWIIMIIGAIYYYVSVSQKLKTYMWI